MSTGGMWKERKKKKRKPSFGGVLSSCFAVSVSVWEVSCRCLIGVENESDGDFLFGQN